MSLHSISEHARHSLWELSHDRRVRKFTGYPFAAWVATALRLGLYKIPILATYDETILYHMTRSLRPEIAIETGTDLGVSTFFILKALDENGKGRLFSIDLPHARYSLSGLEHEDSLPPGLAPGCVVPSSLRGRWTLIIGDAKSELPRLLESLDRVDMFLHDSEHTYDHMMFEFKAAWPKLGEGALLITDDVQLNDSFTDFCKQAGHVPELSKNGSRKYGWVRRSVSAVPLAARC